MKKTDNFIFWIIILISYLIGYIFPIKNFNSYLEMTNFLYIMIGFKIFSLYILFKFPLKDELGYIKNKIYKTELLRLKDYYKHSLYFEFLSIILLIIIPNECSLNISNIEIFTKSLIVLPILMGVSYCSYKIFKDFLNIFTLRTKY